MVGFALIILGSMLATRRARPVAGMPAAVEPEPVAADLH
jgi:hypothetical protein